MDQNGSGSINKGYIRIKKMDQNGSGIVNKVYN